MEEAMQYMYDNDPEFAGFVDTLVPNIEELHEQVRPWKYIKVALLKAECIKQPYGLHTTNPV